MSAPNIPDWVRLLVRSGCAAPSADNSQPWRFAWDGQMLTLGMDPERGGSGLGADHAANLMAMGAVVENLAQAVAALGLPDDALKVGRGQGRDPFAAIEWHGPVPVPRTDPELPLFRRHTNRGPYATRPLEPAIRARIAGLTAGTARTLLFAEPAEKRRIARLLRDASEVRFQTEEIHRWLGASLRFTPAEVERGDGLDVATLLLPPGATALLRFSLDWRRMAMLNRFGGYKLFAALEAAMLGKSGALVAVVGPVRGRADVLAAGRLLERVWILANDAGLGVHPYYVLSDQLYRLRADRVATEFRPEVAEVARGVAALLGSSDETIYMLLRVGHPKIEQPIRSRRLPPEATLTISGS